MKDKYGVQLYKPQLEDLWFRESIMMDSETMSYNDAWGGTIPFPKEKWKTWYDHWMSAQYPPFECQLMTLKGIDIP